MIESGASSGAFWLLTFLALPRFLEIILPVALLASIIFTYNRMIFDSELVAIKSAGYSPLSLARPAIFLAVVLTVFLWAVTMWISPKSLSEMQHMRQIIKTQFSALLFREGVFNQAGKGLTVYIRDHTPEGELRGLMIHDSRDDSARPSIILAKRGVIVSREEGEQVVVFDGSRQEYDRDKGAASRLNFERYTIDLPDGGAAKKRWREPEERTIFELLNPDADVRANKKERYAFMVEIHRRITAPLIAIGYALFACAALLVGPIDRRGQARKITIAIGGAVLLQALFLVAFSFARKAAFGVPFMYVLVIVPALLSFFFLSGYGEGMRRKILYGSGRGR